MRPRRTILRERIDKLWISRKMLAQSFVQAKIKRDDMRTQL